jgi:transcriptional regulator with XRE-family HTH domain
VAVRRGVENRGAASERGWRLKDLAEAIEVDPKTVERWITTGRLPRQTTRRKVAEALGVPESVLWPDAPGVAYGTSELVGIYPTRKELPPATVSSMLEAAHQHVDVLAYAALWLWDAVPQFTARIAQKISDGAEVRICLGDPRSDAVALRGQEENAGDGMASRCCIAANYATVIQRANLEAVRQSDAILYNSIFRFDDEVLVNSHFWGNPAADSPVYHFRRHGDNGIAANAIASFERVWEGAQPLPAG